MLAGYSEKDLQQWKNDMYGYEKGKRTKKPFGKQFSPNPQRVTQSMVKQQQRKFDPVLQTYTIKKKEQDAKRKEDIDRNMKLLKYLKFSNKNAREYDIVNLYGSQPKEQTNSSKVKAPIRNAYNPINNQPLPEYYFRNRDVRVPKNYNFKNISPEPRQFNIVTGQYHEENNERQHWEQYQRQKQIYEKLRKKRSYDPVYGRYYDPHQQEQYDEKLAESQLLHGSHYQDRFPPSYRKRQPLILNRQKPPTQSLIDLDKKKADAKQRYKLKYLLQEEYARRNIEYQDKKDAQIRNRVHNSHILQMKGKEFDSGNMSDYGPRRGDSSMGKPAPHSDWADGRSSGRSSRRAYSGIKSSGFC